MEEGDRMKEQQRSNMLAVGFNGDDNAIHFSYRSMRGSSNHDRGSFNVEVIC